MATSNKPVRIAVDAMGGDNAPGAVVAGAVAAARMGGVQIMLVGDPAQVQAELERHDTEGLPIGAIPSEGIIIEGEAPALALRQKPRASILVATMLVKQGKADALVSMGSTGAAMASAAVVLGLSEGVDRPALGGPILGLAPHTFIIDLGTNVDCRPTQLLSFAVIGDVFARQFWGVEQPRVAMLSVGAEAGKGNRQVRETTELLLKSGLNFTGNVEGDDLVKGNAEVVVCDGYVGNIVMKLTEGLGLALSSHLRQTLSGKLSETDLDATAQDVHDLNNIVHTHGGGPIFGVNGISVVGHGAANARAVQRAIGTAKYSHDIDFIPKLNEEMAQVYARVQEESPSLQS